MLRMSLPLFLQEEHGDVDAEWDGPPQLGAEQTEQQATQQIWIVQQVSAGRVAAMPRPKQTRFRRLFTAMLPQLPTHQVST